MILQFRLRLLYGTQSFTLAFLVFRASEQFVDSPCDCCGIILGRTAPAHLPAVQLPLRDLSVAKTREFWFPQAPACAIPSGPSRLHSSLAWRDRSARPTALASDQRSNVRLFACYTASLPEAFGLMSDLSLRLGEVDHGNGCMFLASGSANSICLVSFLEDPCPTSKVRLKNGRPPLLVDQGLFLLGAPGCPECPGFGHQLQPDRPTDL